MIVAKKNEESNDGDHLVGIISENYLKHCLSFFKHLQNLLIELCSWPEYAGVIRPSWHRFVWKQTPDFYIYL